LERVWEAGWLGDTHRLFFVRKTTTLSLRLKIFSTVHKGSPMNKFRYILDSRRELILKAVGEDTLSVSQLADRAPRFKRPTLKKDLSALVRARKLKKNGVGKGVTYTYVRKA
jgi:predicted HTH transcriptional regulator